MTTTAVTVISQPVAYRDDPTLIFNQLCQQRPATLLLESAEIANKHGIKSLLIIDSAVRITARQRTVTFEALIPNGQAFLQRLQHQLSQHLITQATAEQLILDYPAINPLQDEDRRLKACSVFDALRSALQLYSYPADNPECYLLGGLFSYDLVASFEDLPLLPAEQQCPDYCFYLAETLLSLNHHNQTATLQATLFTAQQTEKNRLTKRLASIEHQLQQPANPIVGQAVSDFTLHCNQDDENYCQIVEQLKKAIQQGDIFQVVPSRRFSLPCPSPLAAYQALKESNPSPYMFYMQDTDFTLFGASPESALKYNAQNRQIEIYPIA